MLNRIYIISDNYSFGSDLQADSDVYFSWLVDPIEEKQLKEAYRYFSMRTDCKFCLSLKITNHLTEGSIRSILSFFFLPAYTWVDGTVVINITGSSESLLAETTKLLSGFASQQGFENITINTVPVSAHPDSRAENLLFTSVEKLIREYESILLSDSYFGNNIFLTPAAEPARHNISVALLEIEEKFEKTNSKLFSLASDNILLRKKNSLLERKYQVAENELNNQKQYADILRSTHSTRQLQDFYNKEYEVLPGWYKRFGHIIKVITGKRTFKSLFYDKVKKYKD